VRRYHGRKYFFERWVHDASSSGIIFYSTPDEEGKTYYVVEGYGIGTINTKTFSEREEAGIAPIQRSRHYDSHEARKRLEALKEENLRC
jgi:hypothetical protein